ncbi:MAG: PQQ-dependent sugar dehydrogenase [Candidatus Promineifilaceae bacterium]
MHFLDFGRKYYPRSVPIWGSLLLCLCITLLWLQFSAQAQTDDSQDAQASSTHFLPIMFKAPEPPKTVEVRRVNTTSLTTCGVSAIANAGDDRLFVAQQDGLIVILDVDGTVLYEPFIDLTSFVTQTCSEQRPQAGLLGLAFHPNYATNGHFFVTYTREADEAIVLSRFTVGINPDRANPSSEQVMLVVEKPTRSAELTHNGGALVFGPQGDLFVALGDGDQKPTLSENRPGDVNNHAQRLDTLLGKVLRLDVDGGGRAAPDCGTTGYQISSRNELADGAGGVCDEIWGSGLHAPWGLAFDDKSGLTFLVDSAEYKRNEINRFLDNLNAPNFGWRCAEGRVDHSTQPHVANCPAVETFEAPALEYSRSDGCQIVGGQVHGATQHTLEDHYLFTDACESGQIGRIDITDPDFPLVWMTVSNLPSGLSWNASGTDVQGNVYFSEFSFNPTGPINIYRVVDPQLSR